MALSGLWGTFFSREGGAAMHRLPKPLWFKVILRIAAPVAPDAADAGRLRQAVIELGELRPQEAVSSK